VIHAPRISGILPPMFAATAALSKRKAMLNPSSEGIYLIA
jgi:hypothetical protein